MGTSSRSITQHPLFPAVVTLWFGATFGLCSLVIGRSTLESWVVASGLPQYLSAAQPPLGSTARVLVALLACGVGAAIGLALAAMLVRAKAPSDAAGADHEPVVTDEAERLVDGETIVLSEDAEYLPALPAPVADVEDDDAAEERVAVAADDAVSVEDVVEPALSSEPEPEPTADALAPFLRREPEDGPRAPFSVFDELGPELAIGPALEDPELQDAELPESALQDNADPTPEEVAADETDPVADYEPDEPFQAEASPEITQEPAPPFAGSPPLPSNVHAIDPARMAQNGLPTRFARADAPAPLPEASAPPAASKTVAAPPAPAREDLSELSYLQLTERLAQAIARNPRVPERLRRSRASTAVSGPGIERLREMHARTVAANESRDASPDDRNSGAA